MNISIVAVGDVLTNKVTMNLWLNDDTSRSVPAGDHWVVLKEYDYSGESWHVLAHMDGTKSHWSLADIGIYFVYHEI